jgi:hypothetical protein
MVRTKIKESENARAIGIIFEKVDGPYKWATQMVRTKIKESENARAIGIIFEKVDGPHKWAGQMGHTNGPDQNQGV